MSNSNGGNIAERFAVLATIDPAAVGTGASTTDIIDMAYWEEVMFVCAAGTLGTAATADFLVKGSAASNMGTPGNLTGKAITQLVKASNDGSQAIVRVTAEEVAAQGYRYIQGTLTIGAATSGFAVIALGAPAAYSPVAAYDLASVAEIVM